MHLHQTSRIAWPPNVFLSVSGSVNLPVPLMKVVPDRRLCSACGNTYSASTNFTHAFARQRSQTGSSPLHFLLHLPTPLYEGGAPVAPPQWVGHADMPFVYLHLCMKVGPWRPPAQRAGHAHVLLHLPLSARRTPADSLTSQAPALALGRSTTDGAC